MKLRKALAFIMIIMITMQMCVYEKADKVEAAVLSENVSIFTDIYTDKAMYNPDDNIEITININNNTQSKISKLEIQPMHLNKKVGSSIKADCIVEPFTKKTKKVTWNAGSTDYQGYLLEVYAKDDDGKIIDQGSIAVDVSSDWRKFPRYGYVYNFDENANTYGKIEQMSKYHLNVIEYYDWQYQHHQPLAPQEMLDNGVYEDWAGRKIYVNTIKNYLKNAKSKNMASMAYDMIYAGTDEFVAGDNNEHKEWQVYFKDDNNRGSGPFYFTMGTSPSGNGHLYFMNPLNTKWQNYIFGEVNKVFDYFDFDGWHGDTVGDWGNMTTFDGNPLGYTDDGQPIYSVTDTYKQFLDAAKNAIGDKYMSFNPVGAKGITQANTSAVDALYTEF
jgi:dextranase